VQIVPRIFPNVLQNLAQLMYFFPTYALNVQIEIYVWFSNSLLGMIISRFLNRRSNLRNQNRWLDSLFAFNRSANCKKNFLDGGNGIIIPNFEVINRIHAEIGFSELRNWTKCTNAQS